MGLKRIIVSIDGPNLYHTQKKFGKLVNFWRLFQNISDHKFISGDPLIDEKIALPKKSIIIAKRFYYDAKPVDHDNHHFLDVMIKLGFTMVPVPFKIYANGTPQKFQEQNGNGMYGNHNSFKSRTEFPMYMDILKMLYRNKFDILILFSGDSDFEFLVKECILLGKRVIIFSCFNNLAKELREMEDTDIILLENLENTDLLFTPLTR